MFYENFRFLILRHREYNGDISDVGKIDLQGRSYDPTESHTLGSFSKTSIIETVLYR